MKQQSFRTTFITVLAAMTLIFANTQSVFAQDSTPEIQITATVVSVDLTAGNFVVETETGEVYTVVPEVGFDFTTIEAGTLIEVQGTLNEDGSISAIQSIIEDPVIDEPVTDPSTGYYCIQSEDQQPFGAKLAERYENDYATLQGWFCDGAGWGQIMLALKTSKLTGETPESLLAARSDGLGWGQIWHGLGLIGRAEDAGTLDTNDRVGKPNKTVKPRDEVKNENSGRPEGKGQPEGKGPKSGRP